MSDLKSAGPKEEKKKDNEKKKKKKPVQSADGKSKSSGRKASTTGNEVVEESMISNSANKPDEPPIENLTTVENAEVETNPKSDRSTKEAIEDPVERGQKIKAAGNDALKEMDFKKLAELKEAFHLFDFDKDGVIDKHDLKLTFSSLGKPDVSDEQLNQMLSEMPDPVDFDAFVTLFGYKATELDPEEVLSEALSKWDYEENGMISEERIRHDLRTWGDRFTSNEIDCALEEAPLYKKKGCATQLDYIEFCNNICGFRKIQKARLIEKEADALEKALKTL